MYRQLVNEVLDDVNKRYLYMGIKYEVTVNSGIYSLIKYLCNDDTTEEVVLLRSKYISDISAFLGHTLDSISTISFLKPKGYLSDKDAKPYLVYLGDTSLGCYVAESFCIACVKALDDASVSIEGDTTPVKERKLGLMLPELTYNGLKLHSY